MACTGHVFSHFDGFGAICSDCSGRGSGVITSTGAFALSLSGRLLDLPHDV
jgi:hypothetical protein